MASIMLNSYTLTITKLIQYFDSSHLFSVDIVGKRKPAPDLFLHILDFFKIKPEKCLVVEDHPLGVRAARCAKIPAWGFLGGSHAKSLAYQKWIAKEKPNHMVADVLDLKNSLHILGNHHEYF